jgi:hypothetical protein
MDIGSAGCGICSRDPPQLDCLIGYVVLYLAMNE